MNIMINLDYHRIVYSIEAQMELDSIEDYLYSEMQFSREYAHNYVEDMKRGFEQSMLISFPSQYEYHKRHGKYVAAYRRTSCELLSNFVSLTSETTGRYST